MVESCTVTMIWAIDSVLIISATILLIYSVVLSSKIIKELNTGTIRNRLLILRVMIIVFFFGYIGFWTFIPHDPGIDSLIVSAVFFFGAAFTNVVCWLMLQTIRDIKRVATLEEENITDSLLGIYNRRYLEQRLKEETARSQRYKTPLSLLMLDIDHFKQVNDQYGHASGDLVLSNIGQILQAQIRKIDLAARYGGEEIVILLPNTNETEALIMAERIRQAIEQTPFKQVKIPDMHFFCTVSLGISSFNSVDSSSKLLHKADVALYKAKKAGRNRVIVYKPEYDND
jgi:diguanylate cyclase (GGDEF)-like protein